MHKVRDVSSCKSVKADGGKGLAIIVKNMVRYSGGLNE